MLQALLKFRRVPVVFAAAFVTAQAALPQQLPAQAVPVAPVRFEVRAWPEGAVLAGTAIVNAAPNHFAEQLPHATCAPCDPSGLWGIDARAIGLPDSGISGISNVTLLATVGGSAALLALSRRGETQASRAAFEDVAVFTQAVLANGAATNWLKTAFHRPRPYLYTDQAASFTEPDDGLSFPSGHTSTAFAAATAYASVLQRRGVLGRHRLEVAALYVLAATTGALRVAAHKHFPTDVVAGAALGTAIGWFVPQLYPIQ